MSEVPPPDAPREAPTQPAPEPGAGPASRPRRMRDTLIVLAASVLAFVIGLSLFNGLVMPRLIHGTGDVEVPDLANLTLDQAEAALRPTGLSLSRAGERFDPSVPRGFILSQDPPPATPVRGRKRVLVMVSLGEEFSSVPELFGESRRGAQLLLERAGLSVGGVTRAPNDQVGEGLIAGSDPPAESVLPRGTPVALLMSTGTGGERFVMPDLTGREIGGVRRQLEALGFRVMTPPAAPTVGPILAQSPPPGSQLTRDMQIVLQATGRIIR